MQLARRIGAGTVVALAGNASKRSAALRFGAHLALDPADPE